MSTSLLLDKDGNEVAAIRKNYVTDAIPNEYGDYLDLDIQADGRIANWEADPDLIAESFSGSEE